MNKWMIALLLCTSGGGVGADVITVPAGAFAMGCSAGDTGCESDEGPPGGVMVDVPAFRLDRHEATVSDYRACVEAGKCSEPLTNERNQYCNYAAAGRDEHPVNCVDWQDAQQYCHWRGGRLPWEAEWEKAARAGSASRYPQGQSIDCAHAILDDGTMHGSAGNELDGCGEDRTWPVGSRPANTLGFFDMHGNVGEWTDNWYAADALVTLYAKGDLSGPAVSAQRVARGGSWDEERENLRSSFRNTKPPEQGNAIYGSIGFRCAYPGS